MADGVVTRTLGLSLGDDERQNRNWELIDSMFGRISSGAVVAGDLDTVGRLHVAGSSVLDGALAAPAGIEAGAVTARVGHFGSLRVSQQVTSAEGLIVESGPAIFPPQSLDGAQFAKGATIQGVWVGSAETTPRVLGVSPTALASVTPTAAEEPGRIELVFAQGTYQVQQSAAGSTVTATFSLRRGDVEVQSRAFRYSAGAVNIEIPLTMVRLTRIGSAPAEWTLSGSLVPASGAAITVRFAQLHIVQFR